jgi:hypothetical protein
MDPQGALFACPLLAPELVHDPVGGEDLIPIDEEQGQKRLLFVAPEVDDFAFSTELECAEDIELNITPRQAHLQPDPAISVLAT